MPPLAWSAYPHWDGRVRRLLNIMSLIGSHLMTSTRCGRLESAMPDVGPTSAVRAIRSAIWVSQGQPRPRAG